MKQLHFARNGYLFMTLVFCLSGIIFMLAPQISARVLSVIIGILMLFYGVVKIIGYCSKDLYNLAFQYDLACGILLAAVGMVMLFDYSHLMPYFPYLTGLLIFFDGLLRIQMTIDAKRFGIENWYVLLTISVMTSIFGATMIILPYRNDLPYNMTAGIALILEGILNCCVVHFTVKKMKGCDKQ
ncbi:MAG: HdeD family acid-resistance protein [Candidatus Onthomonas sp.]